MEQPITDPGVMTSIRYVWLSCWLGHAKRWLTPDQCQRIAAILNEALRDGVCYTPEGANPPG